MEAILDAHFSVLALNASRHEATRWALHGALEVVATADLCCQEVEAVLGHWTHISHVIGAGGTHVPPSTDLYQIEQLRY